MSTDGKRLIYIGVFAALCLLGWFSVDIRTHLPRMAAQVVDLAIFLGLIGLLGYAKKKG